MKTKIRLLYGPYSQRIVHASFKVCEGDLLVITDSDGQHLYLVGTTGATAGHVSNFTAEEVQKRGVYVAVHEVKGRK